MMKHLLLLLAAFFLVHSSVISQEKPKPVPSLFNANQPVPEEIIKDAREFREHLLADPYRPAYHFCIPEGNGRPGDPNGAFFHNGRYHLMYLYNRTGTGFCWGHISSSDLLNWRHHPDAIRPRKC